MIETLAARLGEPGGPHSGRPTRLPSAGSPRSRPRDAPRSPSPPASSSASARRAPNGSTRCVAIARLARAPRARAGGDRPELPAQARHRDVAPRRRATATSSSGPSPRPRDRARRGDAPPGAAEPLRPRRARRAHRRRHRRLGRRVAGHARSRESRAAVARARRAARRHRGRWARRSRRASPCTPSTCATPSAGSIPTCGSRCSARPTPRAWHATTTGPRAATCRRRRSSRFVPTARARGHAGRRGARRRPRGRRGRRRRDRHAARARAVPSSTRVARSGRRAPARIVGDVVTFVRNRNINYTNICTFKCRFCAFSKGPLSLNLRGDPYLLELEEIQRRVVEAVECGATEVCLQGGIHPDFDGDYYLDVARAVKEVAPDDPRARLHRARGHRRRAPPRHAARATTSRSRRKPGSSTLPGTAAEILDDEVRAVICPDKVNTEEWLEAHRTRALGRPALEHHDHVRHTSSDPMHVARHIVRTRELQKETGGFTEFVPLPFVHMATPIFLQQKRPHGPHDPRGAAHARRRAHRVPGLDRQHPGVVGEVRHRRRAPGAASRLQRPRRHADGREHLACGGRRARPGARRRRASTRSSNRSAAPLEQRTTLYGRAQHRRPAAAAPPEQITTTARRRRPSRSAARHARS